MKPFRSPLACAVVAVSLLGSLAAGAEPPTRAQKDAADHTKRAFEAVRRADAETARVEFLQAYALVPSPKALWNLLVAEADSNHPLDAMKHLRAYLADPAADPKKNDRAQRLLTELSSLVGHLSIVAPQNVAVRVDGLVLTSEQRTVGVDVAPGKHVIEATIGDEVQRREVDVAPGDPTLVAFEVPRQDEPVETPAPIAPVSPPQAKPVPAPIHERSRGVASPPLGTWIMGSVAVAALGTGIAFSLSAKSNRDEIDQSPKACANPNSPECARIEDLRDSGSRASTVAWIAYGTAGAAVVAGGLIWYFAPKKSPASRDATISPLVSPGTAGLHFRGSF
ncbi:hypothetical protein LVJ94_07580 [Pendulispora rubella]|uniref:PEGA domain-containing protein n=1 Tax=Pendulispora rubella TaxID=2741070 RepID=A0ABZ2LBZ4_9BACT